MTDTAPRMTGEELNQWCLDNWRRVPEDARAAILQDLRHFVPTQVLDEWKTKLKPGLSVLDISEPGFHSLGGGMALRNRMRKSLRDDQLPPVTYPDGSLVQNWDDFYTGALHDLVLEHKIAPPPPEEEIDIESDLNQT